MAVKTNYNKNGSSYYRVTATVGKDSNGKNIRKEFYGKSKKEAEEKRDEYLANIKSGLMANYNEMYLGDFMKIWLYNVVKPARADNTLLRYLNVFDNYIKNSELYHLKVYSITSLDIQRYYNRLSEEGKTFSMIFNLNKVLKTFFNYCVKQRYILINPCMGLELPKKEVIDESDKKVDPFTNDEIAAIMANCRGYMLPLVSLAFGTGLREGELLGLKITDIDLDSMTVTVNKALKTVYDCKADGSRERVTKIGTTKTESSKREIPIPQSLYSLLKKHILTQKELYLKNGLTDVVPSLFTTAICSPIDAHNLRRSWERILKRADVRYRKFHNVRHTYATKLFEADVNIKTIQVLLGHSSVQTTEKIYVHVAPDIKVKAVEKINHMFG